MLRGIGLRPQRFSSWRGTTKRLSADSTAAWQLDCYRRCWECDRSCFDPEA